MQQQHFCRRTAWPSPQKPRVANAGAVEYNEISRSDEPSQVTEAPVFDLLVLSSGYQQPAGSSLGDGILCDEVWWEMVIEISGVEGHVGQATGRQATGRRSLLSPRRLCRLVPYSNIDGCEAGIFIPNRRYACAVATRPRAVRSRNPCWIRYGS